MYNKILKKAFAILIAAAVCFTLTFSSFAAVDVNAKGSITLHVNDYVSGVPISDMTFRLYFFASAVEKDNGLEYDYVTPYDDCNMDIDNSEDSYLAVHLTHYAQTHNLPYDKGTTDNNGNAVFSDLKAGLYLVVFSESSNEYFVPSPFVIKVPRFDNKNNNWIFDVIARPKMLSYQWINTNEKTYIKAEKIWNTTEAVPESITVTLLCDYKEAETVTLNESNNWSYRWDNLSRKHSWSVVETDVPDGYKVSYQDSENTVTIINTFIPENPDKPTTTPDDTSTTKPDELIDTGQLNWPIPIFSVAGLLLFSTGYIMLNFSKKDEETV